MAAFARAELTVVEIPRTPERLEADVREVLRLLRTARKTSVQCAQPVMHLARRISEDGYSGAVVGTGAVVLDDRKLAVMLDRYGEEAARRYRREKLEDRHRDCGTGRMHEMARLCGVTLEEPYSDEPLRSYALSLDVKELNRPRQKGIALRAFPEFYGRPDAPRFWRKNVPLQVGSGIREWHDALLSSPLNRRGMKAVAAVYADLLKEEDELALF
jgi:asparagine synthetase B (glutamine-hydrolysing)